MSKKKSKKRIVIPIVVLVIVALGIAGYLRMRSGIANATKTTYDIVDVAKGTIEVRVKGAGSVAPLYDNTVYAGVPGTVDEVFAQNGDNVSAGDVIATFTSDELQTQYDTIKQQIDETDTAIGTLKSASGSEYILSPVKGTVKILYAQDGDSADIVMNRYGALAAVCPDGLMQAVVPYSGDVSLGQAVTVTVDTQSTEGEIAGIDAQAGEITVRFADDSYAVGANAVVSADGTELGSGAIAIANPVYITGHGGTVDKIYETLGADISRGGKLFHLSGEVLSEALYTQIENRKNYEDDLADVLADMDKLAVKAGTDGVVSGLDLTQNQVVQQGAPLFTVQSSDQVKIDVDIDELDIRNIQQGQQASVTFDALPDKEYTATVEKINPIGVSENNVTTYTVTLQLSDVQNVMLGMSADVEIVSEVATDVLVIPIEAIQVINGEKYVVFEADIDKDLAYTPATHKITTGITDGVNVEVIGGLSEGDRVAVPKVQESSAQMFGSFRNGSGNAQNTVGISGTPGDAE